jgi:hypothetical protein
MEHPMNYPCQPLPQDSTPSADPSDWRIAFKAACESLPDVAPQLPYDLTPEGQRWASFKRICPAQFVPKIDRALLPMPELFDNVANWNGQFPGPCASGITGAAKSRAAWWALRQLYVRENKPFAWFPVKRLTTELSKYEQSGHADEFFRQYDHFKILMVDDADKINWDFMSNQEALFAFYDWIYRSKKPCITTTNKSRDWWAKKMGDAFARRLFDDAHYAVCFTSEK